MGLRAAEEIDAWLREGGLVVTASDRAARALAVGFHRQRLGEGLSAWPAPQILDWKSFVRSAWERRSADGRLLLNPIQEEALWEGIVSADRSPATLLEGSRHRLAALAMEAHALLCSHAPQYLRKAARGSWLHDAAAFSGWLAAFDEACRAGSLLSPARLPHELIPLLAAKQSARPPLLLDGFDHILPAQQSLFEAWGEWRVATKNDSASAVHFHEASDAQAEAAACAIWCRRQLAANPHTRLLVVTQEASARRGEIERAFLAHSGAAFEFSLGVPLRQIALARSAHLALRWLDGSLAEQEVDWLFSSDVIANPSEAAALQLTMRTLRRHSLQRPQWTLNSFLAERSAAALLPASWVERVTQAQRHLADLARRKLSPLDWAELVPRLLEELQFAAAKKLTSAEHQALRRWKQTVDSCGSLGFDGRRIGWRDFLLQLGRSLDETLFAPESHDASIQIAGPAESAGLTADAVWFLGANEDAWPAGGATHPLLPVEVQRQTGMPHATPQLDWELAQAISNRLLASAPEVHFSYARQNAAAEARPSRLIAQLAGPPHPMPPELAAPAQSDPLTESFADHSQIPFSPGKLQGGAKVLTAQSQCPFKAFATARLAAESWEPAEAGLTAAERGNLLHDVLHSLWSGPPDGIRTHADLLNIQAGCPRSGVPTDRSSSVGRRSLAFGDLGNQEPQLNESPNSLQVFVAAHVQRVFARELRPHLRERMPRRYLELEEDRLTRLVCEWLRYESARIPFEVAETEVKRTVHINGVTLDLRLDRVDRLNDDSLLVVDYKSGDVSTSAWELPRPDDVQLPLYAGFALDADEELGGLVFAKVRPGAMNFAGYVGDTASTLFSGLKSVNPLMKKPFTLEQLLGWRDCIEQLAKDFVAGRADVDPREAPKTCERCGLQTLCRIQENSLPLAAEDDSSDEEAADE